MLEFPTKDEVNELMVINVMNKLRTLLAEKYPDVDFSSGALYDLLLYPHSFIVASIYEAVDKFVKKADIINAVKSGDYDENLLEIFLSNFNIKLNKPSKAFGKIRVIINSQIPFSLSKQNYFEITNNKYYLKHNVNVKVNISDIVSENDILLKSLGNNKFAFDIDVEAENTGSKYNTLQGQTAVPNINIPFFDKAYTLTKISGGTDGDNIKELSKDLKLYIANNTPVHIVGTKNLYKNKDLFPFVSDISIVGFGHPAMKRDAVGKFFGSSGGYVDIYSKDQYGSFIDRQLVTATMINKSGSFDSTWQVVLNRKEASGIYKINAIILPEIDSYSQAFTPTSTVTVLDTTLNQDFSFIPYMPELKYGTFSSYQKITITFNDTITDVSSMSIGATKEYFVDSYRTSSVLEQQFYYNNNRTLASDYLIKGAIPLITNISAVVELKSSTINPTINEIKEIIARKINSLPIRGILRYSDIFQALSEEFGSKLIALNNVTFSGTLIKPDLTEENYGSNPNIISVNQDLPNMVHQQTVSIFTTPDLINITLNLIQ